MNTKRRNGTWYSHQIPLTNISALPWGIQAFFLFLAVFDSLPLPFLLFFRPLNPNIIQHNGISTAALLCVRRPRTFTRQMNPFSTLKWDQGSTERSKSDRLRISIWNLIIECVDGLNSRWARHTHWTLICVASLIPRLSIFVRPVFVRSLSFALFVFSLTSLFSSFLFSSFLSQWQVTKVQLVTRIGNKLQK